MGVLQKTRYSVKSVGSSVELVLGNVPVTMDYQTALQLAQFLRLSGREAKLNAGDRSPVVGSRGILTDAETEEKRLQSIRDVTARYR